MGSSLKIGKIWGIPVGLHASWFILFGLLTWSLATGYFPREYTELSTFANVLLGSLTTVLFFGSVLAHELGHSFIALRDKIAVKGITLFIFGGVAQIEEEPRTPGSEFRIAIAGPLVSLALAILFGVAWMLDSQIPYLAAPSAYLMRINFILAVFNLIPGFPLDGGRVLRAIVWRSTGDFRQATRVATYAGQAVAFGFIGFGLYYLFQGNFVNGLWLIFIGWFLQNAAASAAAQTDFQLSLHDVTVSQVMTRDCDRVTSLTPLSRIIEERIISEGKDCFIVADNDEIQGMITLREIMKIPQQKWRFMTSVQAMTPLSRLVSIEPGAQLKRALQIMDAEKLAEMAVLDGDHFVGIITRDRVFHFMRNRAKSNV